MGKINLSNLDFERLEPQISEAARLMEMLSHPARLRILCTMLGGEKNVQELAINASLSQPAMSHHLRKLRDSELVNTRRDKQTIYYSLKGEHVAAVFKSCTAYTAVSLFFKGRIIGSYFRRACVCLAQVLWL